MLLGGRGFGSTVTWWEKIGKSCEISQSQTVRAASLSVAIFIFYWKRKNIGYTATLETARTEKATEKNASRFEDYFDEQNRIFFIRHAFFSSHKWK